MLALVFGALITPVVGNAAPDTLSVELTGLRDSQGQVLCWLFAGPDGFPGATSRAMSKTVAPIDHQHAVCHFEGMPTGDYAVVVVHDRNGNGRLDKNFFGLPAEGVGASNNPTVHFGPPKFDAARFNYWGGPKTISIQVRYL
jgi:uncharacterized protein (DUF2141 family)